MKNYILLLSLILSLTLIRSGFCQLIISNQGAPVTSIVQGFIGNGLTISNPVISCPSNAYGTFSNGNATSLGIGNGILLTTGNVMQVAGAAGTQNGSPNMNTNNHTWCEDADILDIEAAADNDCCFLDFDVTPQCNQLTIRFVFGSEEYPEYVSSTFNDAFGFFVSGQNPLGGNYSNLNIATLPNNSTIVSINNINATTNTAYYINNGTSTTIAFDGLTKVISRTIDVVPCQTYHFKLGIADAIDHSYDSGVFIDFLQCTVPLTVSTTVTNATCSLNNGSAIAVTTGGIGVLSYNWFPTPGGGQGTPTVTGLIPGQTYTVTIDDNYACIPAQSSTLEVTGSLTPTLTLNNTTICSGSNAIITAIPSAQGGSYLWNTGDTTSSITVSPSTTTTYSCIYTLNGCSSLSTSGIVTVNEIPPLNVSNVTICSGSSATISAMPVLAGGTYLWNTGATSASIVVSPIATTTYSCIYTLNGCPSGSTLGIVTVNDLPALIVNNSTICNGSSTNVTATPATMGGAYLWNTGETTASITVSPIATTTYSCVYTLNGCSSLLTSGIVTVNPVPTVTVNNVSICSGSSVTVTATPAISGGTYLWNTGVTTSSITVSPTVTTTYSCIYTLNGCSSTEATSVVTVNPLPILTVTNALVCEGDVATIIATPFSNGVYQFNWIVPNGAISPGNASIVNSNVSGAYIVRITDMVTLCTSNNETGILTIIPIPEASISSLSKVCFGTSTTVNFNGTPNSIVSYSINSGPSQTILLNTQGIGSVSTGILTNLTTYHIENISIIETPFCSKVLDTIINIEVEEAPVIDFGSDIIKGCSPLTINFTNESVNSSNCFWDFGDGSNSNNCGLVSHTFNTEGCYDIKLKLTSINGCTFELIKSDMICVDSTPKAIFEPIPNVLSSLNSLSLMQNSSVNADSYNWIFGDGSTSLEFNPEHNYILDDGISEYVIILIAISDEGCRDTTEVTIKVLDDLIYYIPNTFTPDGDKFNQTFHPILTKGFDPYSYNMTIMNRWGEILFESNDSDIGWDGSYNGKVVQDGVYTWIIDFNLKSSDDKKSIKGHLNLLR